jgi:hypothetical protein
MRSFIGYCLFVLALALGVQHLQAADPDVGASMLWRSFMRPTQQVAQDEFHSQFQCKSSRVVPCAYEQDDTAPVVAAPGEAIEPVFKDAGGKKCDSDCYECGPLGGTMLSRFRAGDTPWSVWVWAAPTYTSTAAISTAGFSEGVNLGYRLTDGVGVYGSIGFNHNFSGVLGGGTQVLGTVGLQKFGNPNGAGLMERSNVWILFDQATDTSMDDVYLHQFRFVMGYELGENNEVGVTFSIPTSEGLGGNILSPLGGPDYMTSGGDSFVGPYYKEQLAGWDTTLVVGSSGAAESVAVGVGVERPVMERTNVFVGAKASGDSAWALNLGVSYGLGRADTKWY